MFTAIIAFIVSALIFYLGFGSLVVSLLAGLGFAVLAFRLTSRKGAGTSVGTTKYGTPTFTYQGIDVYGDEGFLTYRGTQYPIANVTKVSYEKGAARGALGGANYSIHVHLRDIKTPRLTVKTMNLSPGGNDETEMNYERLALALGVS